MNLGVVISKFLLLKPFVMKTRITMNIVIKFAISTMDMFCMFQTYILFFDKNTIFLSFKQQEPFVKITKNGQNITETSGYSFDLLTNLSTSLNFKFEIRQVRNISEMIDELKNEVRTI